VDEEDTNRVESREMRNLAFLVAAEGLAVPRQSAIHRTQQVTATNQQTAQPHRSIKFKYHTST